MVVLTRVGEWDRAGVASLRLSLGFAFRLVSWTKPRRLKPAPPGWRICSRILRIIGARLGVWRSDHAGDVCI